MKKKVKSSTTKSHSETFQKKYPSESYPELYTDDQDAEMMDRIAKRLQEKQSKANPN